MKDNNNKKEEKEKKRINEKSEGKSNMYAIDIYIYVSLFH